jgi:polysaccharide export outer membrane protein
MKSLHQLLPVLALVVILTSCIPQKKLLLLQDKKPKSDQELIDMADKSGIEGTYKIQPNDYLFIYITSVEGKNTDFFNMPVTSNAGYTENNQMLVGYYVSETGFIHFPFTGDVYVWGKTLDEIRVILEEQVKKFVGIVNVNVKLMNNTVSVLGEVNFQGNYRITKAKLTIFEAITLAGGFSDFAKRDQVQLVRNTVNGPIVQIVDLSNKAILQSELLYVYPNDLIYISPMKAKTWGIGPTFSVALLSTALTLIILFQTIK